LFAVEAVVLRTGSSFGSVWVVLLGLDLTNDLGQGLDVVAEGSNFGEDGFKRHLVMSYLGITSLSLLLLVLTTQQQLVISWVFSSPFLESCAPFRMSSHTHLHNNLDLYTGICTHSPSHHICVSCHLLCMSSIYTHCKTS